MSIFDTILIIAIAGFVFYGLFFGLIRTLGAFVSLIIGALIAFEFYQVFFSWIEPLFFGYANIGKFLVFLILFSLINRLVGLGFSILDRTFDLISIIPFLKTINRIAGAIFGLLMGIAAVGFILFIVSTFLEAWFNKKFADSQIVPFLLKSSQIFIFFLPLLFSKIKTLMIAWGDSWGW